LASWS
jgi:hypothetical protein